MHWRRGYIQKDERTQNTLLLDPRYTEIVGKFSADNDLPVKFTFPWIGNRMQPGRVIIPKGHIVAYRADRTYQRDYMSREMLPCITVCNGGVNTNDTRNYGGTYTRVANEPLGVVLNNVYETRRGYLVRTTDCFFLWKI